MRCIIHTKPPLVLPSKTGTKELVWWMELKAEDYFGAGVGISIEKLTSQKVIQVDHLIYRVRA
jgi:hypothetical protein